MDTTIGFIGGGNMARSMVGGLIAQGFPPASIWVAEPLNALRESLHHDFAVPTQADNAIVAQQADALVLAVKPQVMQAVCEQLRPVLVGRNPLVISIAAGVQIEQLQRWLVSGLCIVRCMPNTPALVGEGVTGATTRTALDAVQRNLLDTILRAIGCWVWVDDEQLMDAVTAVSGSGPAYFFLLIEAMEAAAAQLGLPPETAHTLVAQTALGAARMAMQTSESPAQLRKRVTSPGGTTQAALEVLEAAGFRDSVARAIARAAQRGQELARALEG